SRLVCLFRGCVSRLSARGLASGRCPVRTWRTLKPAARGRRGCSREEQDRSGSFLMRAPSEPAAQVELEVPAALGEVQRVDVIELQDEEAAEVQPERHPGTFDGGAVATEERGVLVARPGRAYIVEKRGIERRPVRASQDTARTGERHAQLHVRGRDAAALHAIEYRGSQELDVRGVSPHERGVAEED